MRWQDTETWYPTRDWPGEYTYDPGNRRNTRMRHGKNKPEMVNTFAYIKITNFCLTQTAPPPQNHRHSRQTSCRVEDVFSIYIHKGLVSGTRANPCKSVRERKQFSTQNIKHSLNSFYFFNLHFFKITVCIQCCFVLVSGIQRSGQTTISFTKGSPDSSSAHLIPHIVITRLLAVFPMLYITP